MYPGIYARIKGLYRYWFVWSRYDRKMTRYYRKHMWDS